MIRETQLSINCYLAIETPDIDFIDVADDSNTISYRESIYY